MSDYSHAISWWNFMYWWWWPLLILCFNLLEYCKFWNDFMTWWLPLLMFWIYFVSNCLVSWKSLDFQNRSLNYSEFRFYELVWADWHRLGLSDIQQFCSDFQFNMNYKTHKASAMENKHLWWVMRRSIWQVRGTI